MSNETQEYNELYNIPEEITADAKLWRFITIKAIVTVIVFVYFGVQFSGIIYEPLQIPFMIFNGLVGLILCLNSPTNKKKSILQSIIIFLFRDKKTYKPIPQTEPIPDTIKKFNRYKGGVQYVEPDE